jgi:hypothetical protein
VLEEQAPEHQQIVVVDQIALRLALGEVGVNAAKVRFELGETRELLGENRGDRYLGVDVAGVDVVEGLLAGEPALGVPVTELGAGELDEVCSVTLVHDGEVPGKPGGWTEAPK